MVSMNPTMVDHSMDHDIFANIEGLDNQCTICTLTYKIKFLK